MPRTIAIGDIHGCSLALDAILAAIDPRADDTLVTLGDYVDRGLDSRGVLDRLIALKGRCRLVPLIGNHDKMFLDAIEPPGKATLSGFEGRSLWMAVGGVATLQSYDVEDPSAIPRAHIDFLRRCRRSFETGTHIFVHANYDPARPLAEQIDGLLLWESLRDLTPGPHVSGKVAIVGHTSQKSGEILDLGYLKCIDTYCYGGGWLTALDVDSGRVWQADEAGRMRASPR